VHISTAVISITAAESVIPLTILLPLLVPILEFRLLSILHLRRKSLSVGFLRCVTRAIGLIQIVSYGWIRPARRPNFAGVRTLSEIIPFRGIIAVIEIYGNFIWDEVGFSVRWKLFRIRLSIGWGTFPPRRTVRCSTAAPRSCVFEIIIRCKFGIHKGLSF
jgi:hypothetical protein